MHLLFFNQSKKKTIKVCKLTFKYLLLHRYQRIDCKEQNYYMEKNCQKTLTLKTLNKSNVWDIQENDIFRLWSGAQRDADLKDNAKHYMDIIRSAFTVEEIKIDRPEIIKKYEARGCKIGELRVDDDQIQKWAIKKKPILRVTDLTYENIHHISAQKLIEVLDRNFGGGWEILPQSIQDIIESGFDISTTTLPKDRLKKKGSMYDKKVQDGYEVLEIPKGLWVEAIFAKEKPKMIKPHMEIKASHEENFNHETVDDNSDDDDALLDAKESYNEEEDDDTFDEDKLTEESYRTTFDENPEDLDLAAEDIAEEDSY